MVSRKGHNLVWMACAAIAMSIALAACQRGIPKEALQLTAESLADRRMQTRRFDTRDEALLLSASAALLQDLGFQLDESEPDLGVLVASKERDATEAGQVALSLVMVLFGVAVPWDERQRIRASVVTKPIGPDDDNTAVRVTFQRIVWNTAREVSKRETLNDPRAYQEFFDKLSKAVFLEAHEI